MLLWLPGWPCINLLYACDCLSEIYLFELHLLLLIECQYILLVGIDYWLKLLHGNHSRLQLEIAKGF